MMAKKTSLYKAFQDIECDSKKKTNDILIILFQVYLASVLFKAELLFALLLQEPSTFLFEQPPYEPQFGVQWCQFLLQGKL